MMLPEPMLMKLGVFFLAGMLLDAGGRNMWPRFGGPGRDRIAREIGLLAAWPPAGPPRLWTATGLGHGYSSVAVAGGRIYTAGMVDKVTYVIAMDSAGSVLWKQPVGQSWEASERQRWAVPYSGSRATPTLDGGALFFLSELGRLCSLDSDTGKQLWHVDLPKIFNADVPRYGFSESVLVDADRLYCCPGGEDGHIVALSKHDGSVLWANDTIADSPGYATPIIADIGGIRQLITVSARHILAVNPEDGRLLWRFPFRNRRDNNATDPIVHAGHVFVSSGYGKGTVLLKPVRGAGGHFTVDVVWESPLLDNHHGGVIFSAGVVYGAGHESRGWFCLEFKTGRQHWQAPGKGSLTMADGHLYCLDERGTMTLVKATPQTYTPIASFQVPKGGSGAFWAHPVVCDGRLYVRHSDHLHAYNVRQD